MTRGIVMVVAVALLLVVAPALGDGKAPTIRSASYAQSEHQSTLVEVGVERASRVTLAVGRAADRDRLELERSAREAGVTFWATEIPDREEKCAPVVLVARGEGGVDERRTRICTFGPSTPEPPELTPDLSLSVTRVTFAQARP